jgi:hypothetical protein
MWKCCIKLLLLNKALSPFIITTRVILKEPATIFRYQSFFEGLIDLSADKTSCTTLFDLRGVSAMISLAAAITIQKIADSRIAIIT